MEGYKTISELAKEWNLTVRRVQNMCADGILPGAYRGRKGDTSYGRIEI